MIDPHALAVLEMVEAASLMARRREVGELGLELADNGAQPLDIGFQHVPFEEQQRQILLGEIDNLVHFDTNSLTRGILHENRKMIQRDAALRSRLRSQCVDLAKRVAGFEQNVSVEQLATLLVDQLAALGDRRLGSSLAAGEAVGTDENALLAALADAARDRPGELILAVFQIGLGGDQEALVLDLLGHRRLAVAARLSPTEQILQERQRGCSPGTDPTSL